MKKKVLIIFIFLISLFMLNGCKKKNENDGSKQYEIYELAKEAGYLGTYEEWLQSIKGADGKDGREIELAIVNNKIVWRYVGETTWKDIYSINDLIGPKGDKGDPGEDGKTPVIEIGTNGNWFINGIDTNTKAQGTDAKQVEFNVSPTHVVWRYVGEVTWKELISLDKLKGKDGADGQVGQDGTDGINGKSAYELAVDLGFKGTVSEWIESLKGTAGAKGEAGQDGTDGREIELNVSKTHIEWRYKGETSWKQLISLDSLRGENGTNGQDGQDGQAGQDGTDGREVEFNVSATHIVWRYKGTDTWTNLVSLESLKGKDGTNGQDGQDGHDGQAGQDGTDGKDGINGKSAYEIAVELGYTGTPEEWIQSLKGTDGAKGEAGSNGVDGREVEFNVSATHIEWRYKGETNYTQLISLDSLRGKDGTDGQAGTDGKDGLNGKSAYDIAVELGYVGTVSEWINSLKGTNGADGREVEFNVSVSHIVWRYTGELTWTNLVSLESLKGNDGAAGADGKSAYELAVEVGFVGSVSEWVESLKGTAGADGLDGADGREIELNVSSTHIEWRYVGEEAWKQLISLDSLRGKDGTDGQDGQAGQDGTDGREVEFNVSATHIVWRYKGTDTWTNLVSLESLKGKDGNDGQDGTNGINGKSAYEIAVELGFSGTVSEWIESLKGTVGAKGEAGADGVDGREIELNVSSTHIEWRYKGETSWKQLISLDSLRGQNGTDGQDGQAGQDGREVEFNVSASHIVWRYKGTDTWTNLVSLDSLKGKDGTAGQDGTNGINGKSAYEIAVELGFKGTPEEWIQSLKGTDGAKGEAGSNGIDGREVEFHVSASHIEWRYVGEEAWKQLISLDSLRGKDGADGQAGQDGLNGKSAYDIAVELGFVGSMSEWIESLKGKDGADGREVEFNVSSTHIEWRYKGETSWKQLISLDSLRGQNGTDGQDGQAGQDGKQVEFNVSATHIVWRYVGEDTWKQLIKLDTLKGKDGAAGQDGTNGINGKSAYEIAVELGFSGTVSEWIESLKGTAGADGVDGTDGREIELNVSSTHIEWRYKGDSSWTQLISLDSLRGQNGTDGREVEFNVSASHIVWRYKGTDTWTNLVSLDSLKGKDGKDGTNGINGKSAYDIAVELGFKGTPEEWIQSLKGTDGAKGEAGSNGVDGREVEFNVSATHIEWRYVGEEVWKQLISLESLKGKDGQAGQDGLNGKSAYEIAVELGFVGTEREWLESLKGTDGLSAYQIYLKYHPEYVKSEEEWIDDLVNGRLGTEEETKYTVKFNTGTDLVLDDQIIIKHEKVSKPQDPVKEGYTFLGWYIDDEKWSFVGYPVTMDMTLVAKWHINQYKVTFNFNNGNESLTTILKFNDQIVIPENITKLGYTFNGWDIEIPTNMPAHDLVINATWTINQYTITFNTDGGNEIAPITQDYNTVVNAPEDPTRLGYTFKGWDKEIPANMPAESMTITALWTRNVYTVEIRYNNDLANESREMYYGDELTLENPSKLNNIFLGWTGNGLEISFPLTITENIVIEAQWQDHIMINLNSDGNELYEPVKALLNDTITLPTPTRSNAEFLGWYYANNYIEIKVENEFKNIYTKDLNLTAKWAFTTDNYNLETLLDGTLKVVSYTGTETNLNMPNMINGRNITVIGRRAFANNQTLVTLTLGEYVERVEDEAFKDVTGLLELHFNKNIRLYGKTLLKGCTSLTELTIPNNIELYKLFSTGYNSLLTKNLTNLNILNSKENNLISEKLLNNYYELQNISLVGDWPTIRTNEFTNTVGNKLTLPDSVITIEEKAFNLTTTFKEIFISRNVQTIKNIFNNNNLRKVVVDPLNTTFDSRDNCNAVIETATNKLVLGCVTTVIPSTVKTIGEYAFSNVATLINLNIPEGVETLEANAIYKNPTLFMLSLPTTLKTVSNGAIYLISKTKQIILPKNLSALNEFSINGSNVQLNKVYYEGTLDEWNTQKTLFKNIDLSKANIECNSLVKNFTFKADLNYQYYESNTSDKVILYKCLNSEAVSIDLYEDFKNKQVIHMAGTSENGYYDNPLFEDTKNVKFLTLPNGLEFLDDYSIPRNLRFLSIPKSVKTIDVNRYFGESDLSNLYTVENLFYEGTIEDWNAVTILGTEEELYNINSKVQCNGTTNIKSVNDGKYTYLLTNNNQVFIESILDTTRTNINLTEDFAGYEVIGLLGTNTKGVFEDCINLETIVLPETLETISEKTFKNCYSLRFINIPDSVKVLDGAAFDGCINLTAISLPKGLKQIFNSSNEITPFGQSMTTIFFRGTEQEFNLIDFENKENQLTWINVEFNSTVTVATLTQNENYKYLATNDNKAIIIECINKIIVTTDLNNDLSGLELIAIAPNYTFEAVDNYNNIPLYEGCESLVSVYFSNTLKNINNDIISYSSYISTIYIPSSVKYISASYASDNYYLNTIFFGGTQEQWKVLEKTFNTDLTRTLYTVNCNSTITSISLVENQDYSYLQTSNNEVIILDCKKTEVESIDLNIDFKGMTVIGLGHKYNDNSTFDDTTSTIKLREVKIPDTVMNISLYCFKGASIYSLTLPNGLKALNREIFGASVTNLVLPTSIVYISCTYGKAIADVLDKIYYAGSFDQFTKILIDPTSTPTFNEEKVELYSYVTDINYVKSDKYKALKLSDNRIVLLEWLDYSNYFVDLRYYNFDGELYAITLQNGSKTSTDNSSHTLYLPYYVRYISNTNLDKFDYIFFSDSIEIFNKIVNKSSAIIEQIEYKSNEKYQYFESTNKNVIITGCYDKDMYSVDFNTHFNGLNVVIISDEVFYDSKLLASVVLPRSLKYIGTEAFNECLGLTNVFYEGTEEQWNDITIMPLNENLTNCVIEFESTTKSAQYKTTDKYEYVETDDNKVMILKCIDKSVVTVDVAADFPNSTVITISGKYNGQYYAGSYGACEQMTSIIIPETVTNIGVCAFTLCTSLTSIDLPANLQQVGFYAFSKCNALTTIDIPSKVKRIGFYAFRENKGIKQINLPANLETIEYDAFDYCENLTTINLPSKLTKIDNYLFRGCVALTNLDIPQNIESIGKGAFYNCFKLQSFDIPSNVKVIGDTAFLNCHNFKNINIPSSVETIGNKAFGGIDIENINVDINNKVYDSRENCNAIIETATNKLIRGSRNTTIPYGIEILGSEAIDSEIFIYNLYIPNTVKTIENLFITRCLANIFYDGTELEWSNINIDTENTVLLDACKLFESNVNKFTETVTDKYKYYLTNTNEVILAECLDKNSDVIDLIKDFEGQNLISLIRTYNNNEFISPFDNCKATKIYLPNTIKSLGDYSIRWGQLNNKTFIYKGTEEQFNQIKKGYSIDYNINNINLYYMPDFTGFTIEQNTKYKYMLFNTNDVIILNCYDKKAVNIDLAQEFPGKKVVGIQGEIIHNEYKGAFESMFSLEEIKLPNTLKIIGNRAFCEMTNMLYLDIPDGVTFIGKDALFNYRVGAIILPTSVKYAGKAFGYSENTMIYYKGTQSQLDKCGLGSYNINKIECNTKVTSIEIVISDRFKYCQTDTGDVIISKCMDTTMEILDYRNEFVGLNIVGFRDTEVYSNCIAIKGIIFINNPILFNNQLYRNYGVGDLSFMYIPKVNKIDDSFNGNVANKIYYQGTEEEWNATFGSSNNELYKLTPIEFNTKVTNFEIVKNDKIHYIKTNTNEVVLNKVYDTTSKEIDFNTLLSGLKLVGISTLNGSGAFDDCSSLVSLTLPDTVEFITKNSFNYAKQINYIKLSDNIKFILDNTLEFYNTIIILPKNLQYVGYHGVQSKHIYYTGTQDQWNNVNIQQNDSYMNNVIINPDLIKFEYIENSKYGYLQSNLNDVYVHRVIDKNSRYIDLDKEFEGKNIIDINYDAIENTNVHTIILNKGITRVPDTFISMYNNIYIPKSTTDLFIREYDPEIKIFYEGTPEEWALINKNNTDDGNNYVVFYNIASIDYCNEKGYEYLVTNNKEVYVISITDSNMKDINLNQINGMDVVYLKPLLFEKNKYNSVVLPSAIQNYTDKLFSHTWINGLVIPNTVKQFNTDEFEYCDIDYVFYQGTEDEWNKLTSQMSFISHITEVSFNSQVTSLETVDNAKYKYVKTNNNKALLMEIKDKTIEKFDGNNFENGIEIVGFGSDHNTNYFYVTLFENMNQLKIVVLPETMTTLNDELFTYNYYIQSILIPNSIKKINAVRFNHSEMTIIYQGTEEEWLSHNFDITNINNVTNMIFDSSITNIDLVNNGKSIYLKTNNNKAILLRCLDQEVKCFDSKNYIDGLDLIGIYQYMLVNFNDSNNVLSTSTIEAFERCPILEDILLPISLEYVYIDVSKPVFNDVYIHYQGSKEQFEKIDGYLSLQNAKIYYDTNSNTLERITNEKYDYLKLDNNIILLSVLDKNITSFDYNVEFPNLNIIELRKSYDLFKNCTNLKNVVLPDSIRIIPIESFYNCSALESIILPSNLECIDSWAFESCSKLQFIDIPETVNSINQGAFKNCVNLNYIRPPKGLKLIDQQVFYNCNNLYSIYIPKSINKIGIDALTGTNLKLVYFEGLEEEVNATLDVDSRNMIPATATKYYGATNYNPEHITNQKFDYIKINDDIIINSCLDKSLTKLDLISEFPNLNIKYIRTGAFKNMPSLVETIIPLSVIYLDRYVWDYNPNLMINCEAASQPETWDASWSSINWGEDLQVTWGYKPA